MSNNQATLLTILGIFTIIGLNLAAWNYRKSAQTSKADRLERSIGLAIPDDMRAYVGHRLARARRMSLIGLVLGAWAIVPLIWSAAVPATVPVTGAVESEYAPLLLLLGASLGGGAIGTAISSVKWPVRRDAGEVRYARARAVGLVDYIAPLERRGAWVTVALAALIFLASAVFSSTGFPSAVFSSTGFPSADGSLFSPQPLAAAVWLALVVASLGFFEVVGRRIVNRPQPMASAPELVWDDALRSAEVRDLAHAPIILGMYGLFFGGVSLVTNLGTALDTTAASFLLNGSAILGLILLIAIFVYVTAAHPRTVLCEAAVATIRRRGRTFVHQLWRRDLGFRIMMLTVDPASAVPPFEQLRVQFRDLVAGGELAPGTRLPTVRRLAEDLGIAPNTVARTYRELETDGVIETRGRHGSFVSRHGDPTERQAQEAAAEFAKRIRSIGFDADEAVALVAAALRNTSEG